MTTHEIYWLAGLLEGEGCFSTGGRRGHILVTLHMTDRDTMERAAMLLQATVGYRPRNKPPRKPSWYCTIKGYRAAAWMMTLYALLGARRQARIRELLVSWKKRPLPRYVPSARENRAA
ncbi:MAG: LAGLIDADG family homing endonuclease [Egibacteraceae bacterium]